MRQALLAVALFPLLVTGAAVDSTGPGEGKPDMTGSWQLAADKSDLKTIKPAGVNLVISYPAKGEIGVEEITKNSDGTEHKRSFKCGWKGRECEYTDGGEPAVMSLYFAGAKLMAVERIGKDASVIRRRTYELKEDGSLAIEISQLVPDRAEVDKLVLVKQ